MPQGQYSINDVQSSPPPSSGAGQYSLADLHEDQPAARQEGFWHSLGSVFGLTPEAYQAAKQKAAGMSPAQEAFETVKPPNPISLAKSAGSAIQSNFQKGSQEGVQAAESLKSGDIKGFLAHFIGQGGYAGATLAAPVTGDNLSKAGEQFGQGNIAGGLGTTAGVLAPMTIPEVPGALKVTGSTLEKAAPYVGKGAKEAARFGGVGEFIHSGNPVALAGPVVAPLAERAATGLTSGLGRFMRRTGEALSPAQKVIAGAESKAQAVPSGEAQTAPAQTPAHSGPSTVPRVPSGEIVLNQALTSLDNPTLLKVARSRGINVAKEATLKPGAANSSIVQKIIDDFSPEELQDVRDTGLEISRNKPLPTDAVSPEAAAEAWHSKVLQTFFPNIKIPKAMEARVANTLQAQLEARFQTARGAAESKANAVPVDDLPAQSELVKSLQSSSGPRILGDASKFIPESMKSQFPDVGNVQVSVNPKINKLGVTNIRNLTPSQEAAGVPKVSIELHPLASDEVFWHELIHAQRALKGRTFEGGAAEPSAIRGGAAIAGKTGGEVEQGGHAGGGVSSIEELTRPGNNYVVSRSGQLTYQGKAFAPESTPNGASHVTVLPDGSLRVNAGPQLNAAQTASLRFALKKQPWLTKAKAGD